MHLSKLGPTSHHPGIDGDLGGDLTTPLSTSPDTRQFSLSNVIKYTGYNSRHGNNDKKTETREREREIFPRFLPLEAD